MAFLYITEQGAVLKKAGERLIVEKDDEVLLDTPASKIEGVLIFGNVQFTTQAVRLLFEQGIEMALFSRRGRLLGQLTSPMTKNITLRQNQYSRHADPVFSLSLAKTIVQAKVKNGIELAREFSYNHPDSDLVTDLQGLADLRDQIEYQQDLQSLLGLEGSSAHFYFGLFSRMLRRTFQFDGRRKRPAPDPVNALLSLGYTLVYNEIESLLDGMGFDPYLGFYHQPRYGHATLASDLMEEFRAPLVDRLTLYVINNGIFKEDDFFLHKASGSMYLKDISRKRYFGEYENFVTKTISIRKEGKETNYRALFKTQAEQFKQALMDGRQYVPYSFRWR